MTTLTARLNTLPPNTIKRGVFAGIVWGLGMGIALPAMDFFGCGAICLSDVAITSGVSIAAGIPLFGALVAFTPKAKKLDQ